MAQSPRTNTELRDPVIPDLTITDFLWIFGIITTGYNAGGWLAAGVTGTYVAQRYARQNPQIRALIGQQYQAIAGLLPGVGHASTPAKAASDADDAPPDLRHPNPNPLFDALEARPHRLLVGHTGGGKTTLLHELATGWAYSGQKVMVCDPDAAPGLWPNCRVAGANDDYEGIGKVLHATQEIIAKRRQQRSEGQRTFTPIHLVIDEVQDVIAEVPDAWDVLEPILRRGRKIGIHLTLGVQDSQRATLDLDGKTHLLKNMVVADLYKEADGTRVATFGSGRHIQRLQVPNLPDPEKLITTKKPTIPAQPVYPMPARVSTPIVTASTGETEKLPKHDVSPAQAQRMLEAMMLGDEPVPTREPGSGNQTGTGTNTGSEASQSQGTKFPDGNQTKTTVYDDGRSVTIHNTVIAPSRERTQRQSSPYAARRRGSNERYQQVRRLVREGKNSTEITDVVKGRKKDILALMRKAKAELGV